MPFIKGIDDQGKTHWLQASGYWGESHSATNFTPSLARQFMSEIRNRNLHLPAEDRIEPSFTESWS